MECVSKFDLRKIFSNSELYTGNINQIGSVAKDYRILFRCRRHDTFISFILYDFNYIYHCHQTFKDIEKLNKIWNPSLEFNEMNSALNFLFENVIKLEHGLIISKKKQKFTFEAIVDIVKVKWIFKCEKLVLLNECHEDVDDTLADNYEIAQDLFIKPMINLLFAFQNNFNHNETVLALSNIKSTNFNKNLIPLTQESTKRIVYVEKTINNGNFKQCNVKRISKEKTLKRKNEDAISSGGKRRKSKKDLNNEESDKNGKSSSKKRKKDKNILETEKSSTVISDTEYDKTSKPNIKKKEKLKFV